MAKQDGEIDPGTVLEQAPWLSALARQLVRNEHDGEDLAQDAWVAALEARPDTKPP